jgi:hypothetical protein
MTGAFFTGGQVLLQIELRPGAIYLLGLVAVGLTGKREVGNDPVRSDASAPVVELRAECNDRPRYVAARRRGGGQLLILNYLVADVSGASGA